MNEDARVSGLEGRPTREKDVLIRAGDVALEGTLRVPGSSHGLVVFAHGSGSTRFSRRNRYVAESLNEVGLATLLFDLLTEREQQTDAAGGMLRFDIDLLAARMVGALDWVADRAELRVTPVGLFGASTGAAAALDAAGARPRQVNAVVSRGGRPDLARAPLERVRAPTLLIVGGLDDAVIEMNRKAAARLTCEHRIAVVPGASHLFEEPGTLEHVARLARDWLDRHLRAGGAARLSGSAPAA